MKTVRVIGIGTGNPEHMTMQAIGALNRCDVVLIPRKGEEKTDLAELRREICRRYLTNVETRIVEFDLPLRDVAMEDYGSSVRDWHSAVSLAYRTMFDVHVAEGGSAGLLVWGDPSLYDSTLRMLAHVAEPGTPEIVREVVPGVTSIQALCASHGVPLNTVGGSVLVTTGRRLRAGIAEDVDTIAVLLDGELSFRSLPVDRFEIWWGAYLGLENEIAVSGPLAQVSDRIVRLRADARARHGWIMDTYILRRLRPVAPG